VHQVGYLQEYYRDARSAKHKKIGFNSAFEGLRLFFPIVFWYHNKTNTWPVNITYIIRYQKTVFRLLKVAIIRRYIKENKEAMFKTVICS